MNDGYYLVHPSGLVFWGDYTGWGRAHLIFGVLLVFAGAGRPWAAR